MPGGANKRQQRQPVGSLLARPYLFTGRFTVRDHRTFRALYTEAFALLFSLGHSPRYTALKAVLWHYPDRATRIFFRQSGPQPTPPVSPRDTCFQSN